MQTIGLDPLTLPRVRDQAKTNTIMRRQSGFNIPCIQPVQEKRIKHIDLRHHYIREVIRSKKIELFFIEGAENPADLFTKNLGRVKFQKFREQLGLEFYKD
jgi:hypothetical protein